MFGISWMKRALERQESENRKWELGFDGINQSPIKSVEANIKRGEKAMNTVLSDQSKTTVHRAMYLQGNDDFLGGWVDFVYGAEWIFKQTTDGKGKLKTKIMSGMGVIHIKEARMRKDGLSEDEAIYFLVHRLPRVIAKGHLDNYKKTDKLELVKVYFEKDMVQLRRMKGNNAWFITAFELWD